MINSFTRNGNYTLNSFFKKILNIPIAKSSGISESRHAPKSIGCFLDFLDSWPENEEVALRSGLAQDMIVHEDFISEAEEDSLIREVDPYLRKLRYEYDHWDNVIHGFRETERSNWSQENKRILDGVKKTAFRADDDTLQHVHVLDLSDKGHIKPHVDAVRYCGSTIGGLCLLSAAVMRLRHSDKKHLVVDILLPRRCLYVIRGAARYEFTHEVLEQALSFFQSRPVERQRRVSIICRNAPQPHQTSK